MVKLLSRPFGLPRSITIQEYRKDPTCYLSTYNYKVAAQIGTSDKSTNDVLNLLDTGAGPNLTPADCSPKEALSNLRSATGFATIASASSHRIQVMGIATLTVRVGEHTCGQPFPVVLILNAHVILGTTYIDSQVELISPRLKIAVLRDGNTVAIQKRGAPLSMTKRTKETTTPAPPNYFKILLSHPITVEPESECNVQATAPLRGTVIITPKESLYQKYRHSRQTNHCDFGLIAP